MKKIFVIAIPLIVSLATLGLIVINRNSGTEVKSKAAGGQIDTLSYFKSDHALGDSSDPKNTKVTQIVSGKDIFNVKNNGSVYEYYTYDANGIYLKQDTSVGPFTLPSGKSAASYKLSPGTWMKRFMSVGESIEVPTQVDWMDKNCNIVEHWPNWSYTMTLLENKRMNLGGALGNQDVIVLKYDYKGPKFERFYFARGWGWVKWEDVDPKTNQVGSSVVFNEANTNFLTLKTKCGTPQPNYKLPASPTPVKPKSNKKPTPTSTPISSITASPTPVTPAEKQQTPYPMDIIGCPDIDNPSCYDCNFDDEINIIDFSCFSKNYGKTF